MLLPPYVRQDADDVRPKMIGALRRRACLNGASIRLLAMLGTKYGENVEEGLVGHVEYSHAAAYGRNEMPRREETGAWCQITY